jgi:hypothetical protein
MSATPSSSRGASWGSVAAAAAAGVVAAAVLLTLKRGTSVRPPSVNLLHRLDKTLQSAALAASPRLIGRLHTQEMETTPRATHVVRIALTGGPCAGKSSALAELRKRCTATGFDVYSAPEVPTILFNSGVLLPHTEQGLFAFQLALLKLQLRLERSMTSIAEATGRPSIIIFDRGLLDAKGYMSEDLWLRCLRELRNRSDDHADLSGVTEECLLRRYDGVIHLTTAADGAVKYYKWGHTVDDSGNPVIRNTTPEEAVASDQAMRRVWAGHPRHVIVTNHEAGGFQGKLDKTVDQVLRIAEESHPSESARATAASSSALAATTTAAATATANSTQ